MRRPYPPPEADRMIANTAAFSASGSVGLLQPATPRPA
jgi:hypothetical protein